MGPGLQGRTQEEQARSQRMQGWLRDSKQVFAEPKGLDPETWTVTETFLKMRDQMKKGLKHPR